MPQASSTSISAAEANRKFSQVLRRVREGKSFIVTSHGQPVARIVPFARTGRSAAHALLLAHLRAQPSIEVGRWTREELHERE